MMHHHEQAKGKVAVGMSGGVDSTMAACLLQRQGYEVIGVTMQIWDGALADFDETSASSVESLSRTAPKKGRSGCYGPGEANDLAAAHAAAERLGIPHVVIPLVNEFRAGVLDYFRREYLDGKTPNPCIVCNRTLKFGVLLEKARRQGITFDYFATGHYARVEFDPTRGRFLLKRGLDRSKDQSYFLSHLSQEQLRPLIFPLGGLSKRDVKALARELGFTDVADQQASQDFFEGKDYAALFQDRDIRPGPIVDRHGRVMGQHKGIIFYTIGQRKGLGISGTKEPLYVAAIDGPRNTLTVGSYQDLFKDRLRATHINWIAIDTLREPLRVKARIRHQHPEADATVTPAEEQETPSAQVTFDQPQMSIAPGQAIVFYQDDLVIGGGIIAKTNDEPDLFV